MRIVRAYHAGETIGGVTFRWFTKKAGAAAGRSRFCKLARIRLACFAPAQTTRGLSADFSGPERERSAASPPNQSKRCEWRGAIRPFRP